MRNAREVVITVASAALIYAGYYLMCSRQASHAEEPSPKKRKIGENESEKACDDASDFKDIAWRMDEVPVLDGLTAMGPAIRVLGRVSHKRLINKRVFFFDIEAVKPIETNGGEQQEGRVGSSRWINQRGDGPAALMGMQVLAQAEGTDTEQKKTQNSLAKDRLIKGDAIQSILGVDAMLVGDNVGDLGVEGVTALNEKLGTPTLTQLDPTRNWLSFFL